MKEWLDDPRKLLKFWIGLLVPSSLTIYLLITGQVITNLGFEPFGSITTNTVLWWGDLTTKIGIAIKELIVNIFVVLVIFKALVISFKETFKI